jgi:type IV pilus assembly protein PilM
MLGFLRQKVYPIGVDLGSSSVKLVQLSGAGKGLGLIAAAQAEVPHEIRRNPSALQEWYVETVRELLSSKPFKDTRAITCLPARELLVQHLRLAKMDEEQLEKALLWEAQGKVPFDIHRARLRHIIAGEVYEGSDTKMEVILMAASHNVVEQHLSFIGRTKMQIESINVEPCALVNCFAHLLDKQQESSGGVMFIDLGHSCTKVLITHGLDIVFCRTIGIAAEHMVRSICDVKGESYDQAITSQQNLVADDLANAMKLSERSQAVPSDSANAADHSFDQAEDVEDETVGVTATLTESPEELAVSAVIAPTVRSLCEELRSCVRYHDLMFEGRQVEKVIFVGGQAKNTVLCQQVARGLGLPAHLGDPVARVSPETRTGKHSDLESGERHCEWAVAFGLSLGGVDKK